MRNNLQHCWPCAHCPLAVRILKNEDFVCVCVLPRQPDVCTRWRGNKQLNSYILKNTNRVLPVTYSIHYQHSRYTNKMRNYNMIKGCMYVRSCTGRVSDMRTGQMSLNTNCSNIHTSRSIRTHVTLQMSISKFVAVCRSRPQLDSNQHTWMRIHNFYQATSTFSFIWKQRLNKSLKRPT